jgi:hypothetical protein
VSSRPHHYLRALELRRDGELRAAAYGGAADDLLGAPPSSQTQGPQPQGPVPTQPGIGGGQGGHGATSRTFNGASDSAASLEGGSAGRSSGLSAEGASRISAGAAGAACGAGDASTGISAELSAGSSGASCGGARHEGKVTQPTDRRATAIPVVLTNTVH